MAVAGKKTSKGTSSADKKEAVVTNLLLDHAEAL